MVNLIWLAMILIGIAVAGWQNNIQVVTQAALEGAAQGVKTSLGLIAIISFWLGLMKVAEAAGLVQALAWLLSPLIRWLFPEIPRRHPAMGAIILNLSANILGLGNAATPMGLVAMQEMQRLNQGDPRTASRSMCTFLALNTSCITIVPSTIIGIRAMHGSTDPTAIVGTTILATACGMTGAIILDKIFRRLYRHTV